jgi:tetratricopeptide (TPR) repeat protein
MESEAAQIPLWQQAWAWFDANKKPALLGTGAVAVLSLIVAFVLYHRNEAEIAASEALSNVTVPGTPGASRADAADAFLKVAATYPNSLAGARALLLAGSSFFADGKYPEAKTQFERFTREYSSSPFRGEALLGIASCLNAQGNTADAVMAYKDLIDRRLSEYVLPQARFALACCYQAQNKPELARNLFEEVKRSNPYGSLGSEAGMRLEELKLKYPNLTIPAAPTTTNALPLQPQKP